MPSTIRGMRFLVAMLMSSGMTELAELRRADALVLDIGYRLARGAAREGRCTPEPAIGVGVERLDQYARTYRDRAAPWFEGDLPSVAALAPDGPAARAGVRVGDGIATVAGAPVGGSGAAGAELALQRIDAAARAGPVTLILRRGGASRAVTIVPEPVCATRFQVRAAAEPDARANGGRVEVTTGLVAQLDRDELAAAIAHELAHNLLGHRRRLYAAGPPRAADKRATELEADRLSIRLLAAAGFPAQAAVRLWRRFVAERQRSTRDHPADAERLRAVQDEVARLAR